jgi:hypothetical protein
MTAQAPSTYVPTDSLPLMDETRTSRGKAKGFHESVTVHIAASGLNHRYMDRRSISRGQVCLF